jgi:hypothetical protein
MLEMSEEIAEPLIDPGESHAGVAARYPLDLPLRRAFLIAADKTQFRPARLS